ncbi:MAG TPA: hypothetical protein VJC18_02940, partial [bacterium]|nr:hypothetical protein [bacterium]
HARISFEQGRYVLRTDHPLFVLRDGDEIAVGRHQQGLRNSHLILRNGDVIVFKKYTLTFKVILPFSLLSDVTRDWDTEMRAWSYVATLSDVIRLFSEAQETVRGRANVIVEVPVYHDIPPEALDEIDAHCRRALRTYPRLAGYQLVRARNLGGCKPHTTDMFYCDPPVFEIDIARTISVSDAPRTIAHQPDATCMVTPSRLRDIVNATEEYQGHRLGDVVTVLRTRQGLRGPVKVPERGWTITAFDTLRQRVTVRRAMTADEVTQHAANGFIDGVKRILFGHVERPNELELTVPLEYIATDQQIFDAVNGEQTAFWHLSRRVALLRDHAKMTYAEFQALFGGEFHQQNVGNCYLISVLKALTSDPENFEALMRLSIRPVKEGWEVTVPLGLLNGRKIIITRENLRPCHNPHRGEPDYSRPDEIDSRKSLEPVSGPDGYRILEAVYCKLLKGERGATYVPVDRSVIDQGGFSREAIVTLLGDGIIAERL